jgi:uncharacterized protein YkwD
MKKMILAIFTALVLTTSLQASELLDLINKERSLRKLPQLKEKNELVCAATGHALDIGARKACTHTGRNGSSPGARIAACGYRPMGWGEIVACGQRSPREAVSAWIKSPPHNAIMFSRNYTYFGGSMSQSYWVVVFSK